jgi:hypothetical protein
MHFLSENRHVFCHRCIRKIINSLPLRRKIASQFSSSAYVRKNLLAVVNFLIRSKKHVLKKVVRGRSYNLFSFNVFLNLHVLGYPKSLTIFWFIWVKHYLSMMCVINHNFYLYFEQVQYCHYLFTVIHKIFTCMILPCHQNYHWFFLFRLLVLD